MATYLQFPLVASAVLASIPVLEANETLHLLEQAYDVIGRRAMPLSQPELITLAVRMIHGIRNETLAKLDTTATVRPAPSMGYRGPYGFYGVPMFVFYGAYFATFSAYGGFHPGHAHLGPGGFGGVGRDERMIGKVALLGLAVVLLTLSTAGASAPGASYVPKVGDSFHYFENVELNNGQGNYTGYTESTFYNGSISVGTVLSNGTDNATYATSFSYSNSQGQSSSGSAAPDGSGSPPPRTTTSSEPTTRPGSTGAESGSSRTPRSLAARRSPPRTTR